MRWILVLEESREMLEDLLAAAVNDAVRRAQAAAQEHMASVAGGMNLLKALKCPSKLLKYEAFTLN